MGKFRVTRMRDTRAHFDDREERRKKKVPITCTMHVMMRRAASLNSDTSAPQRLD
jgi:hypothetical protein